MVFSSSSCWDLTKIEQEITFVFRPFAWSSKHLEQRKLAISQIHTYAVIEEKIKINKSHSTKLMNKDIFSLQLSNLFINKFRAGNRPKFGSRISYIWNNVNGLEISICEQLKIKPLYTQCWTELMFSSQH